MHDMISSLSDLPQHISSLHLNILFLLGLALFGGTIGGRIFQMLRIPQVVGYIAIGVFIGQSGLHFLDEEMIKTLQPLNYFALGLIGFMIGGELKKDVLKKYGKQFTYILLGEGLTTFFVVSLLVSVSAFFIFRDMSFSIALGLLLGAIASATAPAATTDVLWENKTRGPLTTTILGIVALDDALALILFAVAASIAGKLLGVGEAGALRAIVHPIYEIGVAIAVGVGSGLCLCKLIRRYQEEEKILAFSIGAVLLVLGTSLILHVDLLLSAMALGVVIVNGAPRKSSEVFKLVNGFAAPIFILFFVMVGGKFNFTYISPTILLIAGVYLVGRMVGKMSGAYLGATLSRAPRSVTHYLPFCLFSQAGVAIGLSVFVSHQFGGEIGATTVIVVTFSTFIVQIIGPSCTKFAVVKAGEVGLNITEDDFIKTANVKDVMDSAPPLIYEHMTLNEILVLFKNTANLYYPVVEKKSNMFLGVVKVEHIKDTFMETGLNQVLLAHDMMEEARKTVTQEDSLRDLKRTMGKYRLDCIPVITADNILVGFVEAHRLQKDISTKVIELQKKADNLS